MNKNERDEQRRQEDMALNRGLIWVGAAIVLELLLLLVNKYLVNVYTTQESIAMAYAVLNGLKAIRIITLVGVFACAGWSVMKLKKNEAAGLPVILSIACAALLFCSHIAVTFRGPGLRMLFIMVPAWAALALVYYLYQREFFLSAALTGMGAAALWLIRHSSAQPLTMYGFLVLMGVVLVVGAVVLGGLRQSNGVLNLNGRKIRLLPDDVNYALLLATAVINVAAVAGAMFLGGTVAYYLIYALVAWLFALLVYYTVKMM